MEYQGKFNLARKKMLRKKRKFEHKLRITYKTDSKHLFLVSSHSEELGLQKFKHFM